MKNIIFILLLYGFQSFAQEKYLTRSGEVSFEASVPSFEPVAAQNEAATAILNTDDNTFAALVLVKAFRFKNALMEQHFNENYAESHLYPKSTLKGTIKDFSIEKMNSYPTPLVLQGELEFHGVKKDVEIPLNVSEKDGGFLLVANFSLNPEDFNVEIPGVVRQKVADKIDVHVRFLLLKK